jgi:YD repeat-containing protein
LHSVIGHREDPGAGYNRPLQYFYDGLGRMIQTKFESDEAEENIVTDTDYDALGRVTRTSQPRYIDEINAFQPGSNYGKFTPRGTDAAMRWTTTTYDALDRPLVILAPGTIRTAHRYGVTNQNEPGGVWRVTHDLIDPNRHRTQWRTDTLGRLASIIEMTGTCGAFGVTCGAGETAWDSTTAPTTRYSYDLRDRLTQVTDAKGNLTTIGYDTLGRKTSMSDPDMGAWSYAYDPNGNLTRQTDATGRRTCFYYDTLDRLTGKLYRTDDACVANPTTTTVSFGYDATASGNFGIGRRTSMSNAAASTAWRYDVRGRKVQAAHTVAGSTATFQWGYDSADRVRTITYPSNETVRYTYDEGWRPVRLCSDTHAAVGCAGSGGYVTNATYTALDQPAQWTHGSGAIQTWQYQNPTQRLEFLRIGTSANLD